MYNHRLLSIVHHGEREYNGNILGLQLLYYVSTDFFFFLLHILLLEIIDWISLCPKCFFFIIYHSFQTIFNASSLHSVSSTKYNPRKEDIS